MFTKLDELKNESDVEQKLVYPLLTRPSPQGLAIPQENIHTKPDIRRFSIEKRGNRKLYYPDYIISISGLPLLVIEVKPPRDDLDEAYREARLYTIELNADFPSGLNPVSKIICTNGNELIAGSWDSNTPNHRLGLEQLQVTNQQFADLSKYVGFEALNERAVQLSEKLTNRPFHKPIKLLGGYSVRNEEIGHNTFGASLALEYRYLFNPTRRYHRAYIVKHAYVPSRRRERYIDPIDRIIRAAAPPSESDTQLIEDTRQPVEVISALKNSRDYILSLEPY